MIKTPTEKTLSHDEHCFQQVIEVARCMDNGFLIVFLLTELWLDLQDLQEKGMH